MRRWSEAKRAKRRSGDEDRSEIGAAGTTPSQDGRAFLSRRASAAIHASKRRNCQRSENVSAADEEPLEPIAKRTSLSHTGQEHVETGEESARMSQRQGLWCPFKGERLAILSIQWLLERIDAVVQETAFVALE